MRIELGVREDVTEMVRRGLVTVLVAVALGVMPLIASACGEGRSLA